MSRQVIYDGKGSFEIRFPFDRELVDRIKSLPNRRWNAGERFWTVPEQDVILLVDLLLPQRFRFDPDTCERYRVLGGTEKIEAPAPVPAAISAAGTDPTGSQRGLFDLPASDTPATGPTHGPSDFTVSGLNERVKDVLAAAFPAPVWLVGEISGFNRNAHKRHVGFKLVEPDDAGESRSSIDATLFGETRREIELALRRAGEPFRLEDEIAVRVQARIELYVPWGSYRVIVEQLDVNYTLGEAARRREAIIRKLTEAGLVGRNTALGIAPLPLRVGVITSLGSDAYNDVLRTLTESGYAFAITAHGARVQGRSTEPSVLNALDWFRDRAEAFDVVLICRGGGSRTDLAWFDSERLGRAVAEFPVPVIVGIGHEQDHSVLDAVGRRSKTPTAAAALLVETVRAGMIRLERVERAIIERAARSIAREAESGVERGRRLARAANGLLDRQRTELGHHRRRLALAARAALSDSREKLSRQARAVPRASVVHLSRQQQFLIGARRAIGQGAGRDIASAGQRIATLARAIGPRSERTVQREHERVVARQRRLELVDPRRVLERGYAILRLDDGPIVTTTRAAPAGTAVLAELGDGMLKLRSDGPANDS